LGSLRALLQRDKGRDLSDLSHALTVFEGLDVGRVLDIFARYLALADQAITRAEAQRRMFANLAKPRFLLDMRPLLSADQAQELDEKAAEQAFRRVFTTLIDRLPGDPLAKAADMKDKFGISW
jgi:hypothetical protein